MWVKLCLLRVVEGGTKKVVGDGGRWWGIYVFYVSIYEFMYL